MKKILCVLAIFIGISGCAVNTSNDAFNAVNYEALRVEYSTLRVARVAASVKYSEIFNLESPAKIESSASRMDPSEFQTLAAEMMPNLPDTLKRVLLDKNNLDKIQAIRLSAENLDLVYLPAGELSNLMSELDPAYLSALGFILDLNQTNGINQNFNPEALVSFGGTQLSHSGPYCIGCFIPFVTCSGCPTDGGGVAFDDFDRDDLLINTLPIGERILIPLNGLPLQAAFGCGS